MTDSERIRPGLSGVPETLLLTLWARYRSTQKPNSLLTDPKAAELVAAIDYPFEQHFPAADGRSDVIALRSVAFDREISAFLDGHPEGTVVCLGEGLETHFWRVDNGRARWLTVDLPESATLREKLLPTGPRQRILACSATDHRWLDEVAAANGVLIVAQGLLMYLKPEEVHDLFRACAERFPGGGFVFDTMPKMWVKASAKGQDRDRQGMRIPPMYWSQDPGKLAGLHRLHPNIAGSRRVPYPEFAASRTARLFSIFSRIPLLNKLVPGIGYLQFR
ncbi:class I SAM-dependent methyltransferase [Pseudonocardiaceae bacterium YIM PH 21723]|nr:class I SAM-dependent methyltransferase [Pseudonocardiaceae bacterium YIM PH 21723]